MGKRTPEEKKAWRDEFHAVIAAETPKYQGVRQTRKYKDELDALLTGVPALDPDYVEKISKVVGAAIKRVRRDKEVWELDRASKTNIGSQIESGFIDCFGLEQLEKMFKIDTRVNGVMADIKTTIRKMGWTIHVTGTMGKWCLLFTEDCKKRTFGLAVAFITPEMLNVWNDDSKSEIKASQRHHVHWVIQDQPYIEPEDELEAARKEIAALQTEIIVLKERITILESPYHAMTGGFSSHASVGAG